MNLRSEISDKGSYPPLFVTSDACCFGIGYNIINGSQHGGIWWALLRCRQKCYVNSTFFVDSARKIYQPTPTWIGIRQWGISGVGLWSHTPKTTNKIYLPRQLTAHLFLARPGCWHSDS